MHLQVKVRPHAVTGVAAEGNELAAAYRQLTCLEGECKRVAMVLQTVLLHQVVQPGREVAQVAIDTGLAVGMANVDGFTEAVHVQRRLDDIAVSDSIERLALHVFGLHVDAAMEVTRTRLTEVTRQRQRIVDG